MVSFGFIFNITLVLVFRLYKHFIKMVMPRTNTPDTILFKQPLWVIIYEL